MRSQSYMTRALKAADPRYAKVLGKLGYMGRVPPPDPMEMLRVEAHAAGVTVDGRWGEERLREEIAAARKPKRKVAEKQADAPSRVTRAKSVDAEEKLAPARKRTRRTKKSED